METTIAYSVHSWTTDYYEEDHQNPVRCLVFRYLLKLPWQDDCKEWHGSFDSVSVRDWNFPDADVCCNRWNKLAQRQRDDELDKVLPREVAPRRSDTQEGEHRSWVDCHRQQLNHCQGHWVGEVVLFGGNWSNSLKLGNLHKIACLKAQKSVILFFIAHFYSHCIYMDRVSFCICYH